MSIYEISFPKEYEDNKRARLKVLLEAEQSEDVRRALFKKCEDDILFFLNGFGWTYDPRTVERNIPFITYPYQDETILTYLRCIEEGVDVFVEKSRDMGASWMAVGVQVWAMLFKSYPSLYGSYKENYVNQNGNMDSHFERLRYFIGQLPTWMLPRDLVMTSMNISSELLSASITGDAGPNFGTGGRRKFTILDEFAYWTNDEKAFRKTADISPCRIIQSTPEGQYNVFGMIGTKARGTAYENLAIERIRLHWTLHPNKDQEWYQREKGKRSTLDIAKELDISYENSVTGAVYPEFSRVVTLIKCEYNPKLPLFTSWDFGRDTNAIIWLQKDYYTGYVYVIDYIQLKDKPIEYMAAFITGEPVVDIVTGRYFEYTTEELDMIEKHKAWKSSYAFHCGDPYNANSVQTNARSSIKQILMSYGITLRTKTGTTVEERIQKTHLLLSRLVVNIDLLEFIQAISQSRYPEASKNSTSEKTKPIHDIYSHGRTALEYFADNEVSEFLNDRHREQYQKTQEEPREEYNYITGRIVRK